MIDRVGVLHKFSLVCAYALIASSVWWLYVSNLTERMMLAIRASMDVSLPDHKFAHSLAETRGFLMDYFLWHGVFASAPWIMLIGIVSLAIHGNKARLIRACLIPVPGFTMLLMSVLDIHQEQMSTNLLALNITWATMLSFLVVDFLPMIARRILKNRLPA